ncbi:MAG: LemA family protein [Candidatus Aenigmarchaeota archaeon]|nr:LemA family protein [Candidatus Aenigmarchaeota archaeon]
MLWVVVIVVVVAFLLYLVLTYNRLVDLKILVENARAQIDVQLKRRFDLIPNLVETVKGYAKHEKEVFEKVAKLRTQFLKTSDTTERIELNNKLTETLKTIFAVAERYPKLRASENFKELQKELERTEDKIAYMRQFYNDVVYRYNKAVKQFPSNIVATIFGFRPMQMFQAVEERESVKVKF